MEFKEAEKILNRFEVSRYAQEISEAGRVVRDALKKRISELQSECETSTALVMSHESTIEGLHGHIAELESDLKSAYSHIAEVDSNIGDEYYKNHQLEEENERMRNSLDEYANSILICWSHTRKCADGKSFYECVYCGHYAATTDQISHRNGCIINDAKNIKNKYSEIRKMSAEDRKEVFDFAMQRSKEILEGSEE